MQFRCAVINGFKRHLRVNFTSSTAAICLHKVSQARVHTAAHARRTLASQTPMQPSACIRCRKLKCRQQRLREEQRTVTRRKLAPYRALLEHRVYRSHRGNFCDSFASVCTHQRCTDRKGFIRHLCVSFTSSNATICLHKMQMLWYRKQRAREEEAVMQFHYAVVST